MTKNQKANSARRAAMPSETTAARKSTARPLFLLVAAGLTGAVLLLAHSSRVPKPVAPEPLAENSGEAAGSVVAVPKAAGVTLGLRKGDRLVYEFHQDRSIQIQASSSGLVNAKGATNQSVTLHAAQAGDLVVNVYDQTRKGWIVGFSIENANLKTTSTSKLPPSDGLEAGLRAEVLAFVENSGRIGKMSAPASTSQETLKHWRDILSRWQTVLAPDAAARTWKRTEEDPTGTYAAVYSREPAQTPATVRKQKQEYLSLNGASQKGFGARCKVNGTAVIELAPYQTSIEGHERLTIEAPEIGGSVNSEAQYSFHLRSAAQEAAIVSLEAEMARQLDGGMSFSWTSTNAAGRQSRTVDVSNTTIEEQVAVLEQLLAAGKGGTSAEVKILEKIVALIKQDDATVGTIVNHLVTPTVLTNMDVSSGLIGMLGAAGTPKAQETLVGIVNAKDWPREQRQMAIFSLVQVTQPAPEVDGWLQQMHQAGGDLANNSLLVLAAMGDRVREQSPERFSQISQYVVNAASAPDLPLNELVVGLDAIGNLGPQEVPQVVRDALAGENPLLREKALQSLVRMDPDTADPMIRSALQSDSDDKVRAAAASLLGDTRRTGGCEDLCQAALKDSSETVRVAAVRSLKEWMGTNPEAGRTLQQAASQDASQDVRNAANEVLHAPHGFDASEDVATAR